MRHHLANKRSIPTKEELFEKLWFSFVAMINDLSYRQIQTELKKRQLNSNGKKDVIIKRLKIAYEKELQNQSANVTKFYDLPNEIYREIFDYLSPVEIIHAFYGFNLRLNAVIGDIPMKVNFENLNKNEYKRVLKQILPKIVDQTISIQLGRSSVCSSCNPEYFIDLFTQSFDFTQFSKLRFLSLTAPSLKQLESLFLIIPYMISLRSLRLLEQDYCGSQNETVCKLVLANDRYTSMDKSNHLTHVFVETSPPFKTLTLLVKHFMDKISLNYLQLNIRCALFFYPDSLTHIDCDGLSRLLSNMNYFKIDVTFGSITPAFDLIQRFPQICYLSVKTISQAYANGYQWAELLTQMPNIIALDLDISLDSYKFAQELKTFQTKFWFERQWIVQYVKHYLNFSEYRILHRNIKVR